MDLEFRRCLKCNRKFSSKGPGNRICGACNIVNRKVCMPGLKTSKVMPAREVAARE